MDFPIYLAEESAFDMVHGEFFISLLNLLNCRQKILYSWYTRFNKADFLGLGNTNT